ncbi:MAG: SUMF1/EgtB/PvdO family nonheme iron enzyme [Planctomycetota bacterium]|nr:SUMF1/EgtB/PvdO family nonheme iron enzyme [Planctomycetota bacterium]
MNSIHALLALLAAQNPIAPPSTVLVPGGRTRIGIEVKDVERLMAEESENVNFAGALIAETPRQEVVVDSCWMMVTEVTQEQYGRFVHATHALPLESWCEKALAKAAAEFADARANELLVGDAPSATRTFDRRVWWTQNAARIDWEIPPEDARSPVVFVDYAAARAYSRWAGMRLPSEFEFQRAIKGDTNRVFPWGNDWDDEKYAVTGSAKKKGGARAVGSLPAGRSKQGVFDLVGNVWEWTSSPFVKYPGYDLRVFEVGYGRERRPINAIADWDPDQRVVVGGSFQAPRLMCRATVRRGSVVTQSTGALGFRCASHLRAGVDMARYVLEDDFDVHLRPRVDGAAVDFDLEATLCVDGWSTTSATDGPEHYAIVEDYRYVLFAPSARIAAADAGAFEKRSLEEPVPLGFLSTNVPLYDPPLDPGSYVLAYRARGVRKLGEPRATSVAQFGKAPLEETLHLDVAFDHVIVSDLRGTPILALRTSVAYGPERESRIASTALEESSARAIHLELTLPCKTTNKGFALALDLKTTPLERAPMWRR